MPEDVWKDLLYDSSTSPHSTGLWVRSNYANALSMFAGWMTQSTASCFLTNSDSRYTRGPGNTHYCYTELFDLKKMSAPKVYIKNW